MIYLVCFIPKQPAGFFDENSTVNHRSHSNCETIFYPMFEFVELCRVHLSLEAHNSPVDMFDYPTIKMRRDGVY